MQGPGFPRAADTNLRNATPMLVPGLASSATAIENARTGSFAAGTNIGVPAAGAMGFDGTNWRRIGANSLVAGADFGLSIGAQSTGADAVSNSILGAPNSQTPIFWTGISLFNGTTWDRSRNGSAAALSATTQPFAQVVTGPGEWAQAHTPAANTQATTTKAAGGAGVRHVCKSICFSAVPAAAMALVQINLRDGASGAGTILWSMTIATAGASATIIFSSPPLNIFGTANTAMTLEFSAAPAGGNSQSVALSGYSTI